MGDQFPDDVVFVPLAPIADPDHVAATISQGLGGQDVAGQSLLAGLQETLRDKRRLLLLDNLEQVVAVAPLIAELLATCSGLKILVTSPEPLHLWGERKFAVFHPWRSLMPSGCRSSACWPKAR